MRVLVANKYWHKVGGVENHVEDVCRWLESEGHEVVPFAMSSPLNTPTEYDQYFPSEVDMRAQGIGPALKGISRAAVSWDSRKSLRDLLRAHAVDAAYVVHIYHQLGMALLNELADQRIPTVLSLHDYKASCGNYRLFSERTNSVCTKCLDSPVRSLWAPVTEACWGGSRMAGAALVLESVATRLRGSYRQPQVVTTLNSLQEKAVISAGVDPERIVRLPHPVELEDARTEPGAGVLYVGRLVPEKGVDILIEACALAGASLTIVGDGRERAALEALAARVGTDVSFLGTLTRAETAGAMRKAALLAVPSVWHEVSPLVTYEAMSLDVPVVGSSLGGLVDQLSDDRGFLVEPAQVDSWASTITAILGDPGEAHRRSRRAREHARSHLTRERWEANLRRAFETAAATASA